jgi:hypothetical protein
MGLRDRLSNLLWPEGGGQPEAERGSPPGTAARRGAAPRTATGTAAPSAPTASERPPAGGAPGLSARLKQVGVSEEQRRRTPHLTGPVWSASEPAQPRAGLSLRQRLQQVGVPDLDAKELSRQQRILEASREVESRTRRELAYAVVMETCPVPIHADRVPLPGGLRLLDDEFLVATGRNVQARSRELTLTTQRLVYTRGRGAEAQLVVHLADVCDVAFHADDTITLGTPSGRWERLPIAGNSVVASRDRLLALIDHARSYRSVLPGGFDELVEMRDSGAVGEELEARQARVTPTPRRTRRRHVELSGRATPRTSPAQPPAEASLAAPPMPAEPAPPGEPAAATPPPAPPEAVTPPEAMAPAEPAEPAEPAAPAEAVAPGEPGAAEPDPESTES